MKYLGSEPNDLNSLGSDCRGAVEILQVKGFLCMIDLIRALGKMALKTTSTKVSTYVELVGPQGGLNLYIQ